MKMPESVIINLHLANICQMVVWTYAEKLGHLKYSQLIQDCFYDLNVVLTKYNTEI